MRPAIEVAGIIQRAEIGGRRRSGATGAEDSLAGATQGRPASGDRGVGRQNRGNSLHRHVLGGTSVQSTPRRGAPQDRSRRVRGRWSVAKAGEGPRASRSGVIHGGRRMSGSGDRRSSRAGITCVTGPACKLGTTSVGSGIHWRRVCSLPGRSTGLSLPLGRACGSCPRPGGARVRGVDSGPTGTGQDNRRRGHWECLLISVEQDHGSRLNQGRSLVGCTVATGPTSAGSPLRFLGQTRNADSTARMPHPCKVIKRC